MAKPPYSEGGLFDGATHLLFERAAQLRGSMTGAEESLWCYLKKGVAGLKFRRQHPLGIYIVDFYCHKVKLVIEVDGGIHNEHNVAVRDTVRQQNLEQWGYTVIRFTNAEVLTNTNKTIDAVSQKVFELIALKEKNNNKKSNT